MKHSDEELSFFDPETGKINFDLVMELSKTDPEKFEELRQKEINDFIASAPDKYQKRLLGLQFKVDTTRSTSKNVTQSYIRLTELFWKEGFARFQDSFEGRIKPPEAPEKNNVLEFKKKDSDQDNAPEI